MQIKPWQLSFTLVCIASGLLFAYDLQLHPFIQGPVTNKNAQMASMIQRYETDNLAYEQEISKSRQEIDAIQKEQTSQGNMTDLQDQMDKARLRAGLVDVEGSGIVLTLNDRNDALELAQQSNQPYDIWDFIVHDSYLLNLVTDLRSAGAEAISLNEERIVTTTDIKCGGTIVFANGTRLGAPFTIKAIGNASTLQSAVEHGFTYNNLVYSKYPINIKKQDKIFIPAYHGSYISNFAKVVKE